MNLRATILGSRVASASMSACVSSCQLRCGMSSAAEPVRHDGVVTAGVVEPVIPSSDWMSVALQRVLAMPVAAT